MIFAIILFLNMFILIYSNNNYEFEIYDFDENITNKYNNYEFEIYDISKIAIFNIEIIEIITEYKYYLKTMDDKNFSNYLINNI